jgi:hypothetical protein
MLQARPHAIHFKRILDFGEGQDAFNIVNHPNFSLSNGNILSNAGVTAATSTHGYVFPTDPNFLSAPSWFSGGIRSLTLGAKFVF